MKTMNILLWILQILLGIFFVMVGAMKTITPIDELLAQMAWVESAGEFGTRLAGISEVLGGLGLILPAALRIKPRLTPIAASALAFVMVLALGLHAMRGEWSMIIPNIVIGLLMVFVAWGRFTKAPIQPK